MNDVLKSLAVWVAVGDAKLGAIGFEKPEDPEQALAERRLNFDHGSVLLGLLGALRGRKVLIKAHGRDEVGDLIGIERETGENHASRTIVALRTAVGIRLIDLKSIESVEPQDEKSKGDIDYLLDRSRAMTAGETRTVRVDLRGEATDVRVSYVVPAPVWRVSYRVAVDPEGVTLMGFGIVHNPADEDLNNIQLTLTTGEPVSFVIDLYNPKTVARHVVEERQRGAAPPPTFARAPRMAMAMAMPAAPMQGAMGKMSMYESAADHDTPGDGVHTLVAGSRGRSMHEGAAVPMASGEDRGEFFEYKVQTPISLRRGGSAMVPLFVARGPVTQERIWSRRGDNPDIVLKFDNFSGAVLEEGPAVVYDEDAYAGEAMVPYSARGTAIRLGYARDLSVRCSVKESEKTVAERVSLRPFLLREEYRIERNVVFRAENDHDREVEVTYERPKPSQANAQIVGATPAESTAATHRYVVKVPAKSFIELPFQEVWVYASDVKVNGLAPTRARQWREANFLDDKAMAQLDEVFALVDKSVRYSESEREWRKRRETTFARMTKITEQLAVLRDQGPEGELRLRYVTELGNAQSEVGHCEAEADKSVAARLATEALISAALERLGNTK
jgi:hypothetical protein